MQMVTVAIRVIQQVVKDKRTLAFLLVAPVFVLGLLNVIMGSSSDEPAIGVIDLDDALVENLQDEAAVIEYASEDHALRAMKASQIDAYFFMQDHTPIIEIEGGDITKRSGVIQAIQRSLQSFQKIRGEEMKDDLEEMQEEIGRLVAQIEQQTGQEVVLDFSEVDVAMEQPDINYLYNEEDADLFDQVAPALMGFFIFLFVF